METRKLFSADGKWWMEILDHELKEFPADAIRWFGPVPTGEVTKERVDP